jgi:hypothetical protein
MKIFFILALMISFNSFAGELKTCKIQGQVFRNTVVPNDVAIKSITKILNSKETDLEKSNKIKSILFIEGVSVGDGKSLCDLAVANYNVTQEKCMDTLKSSELLHDILDQDLKGSLSCKIGLSAKLLMSFKM